MGRWHTRGLGNSIAMETNCRTHDHRMDRRRRKTVLQRPDWCIHQILHIKSALGQNCPPWLCSYCITWALVSMSEHLHTEYQVWGRSHVSSPSPGPKILGLSCLVIWPEHGNVRWVKLLEGNAVWSTVCHYSPEWLFFRKPKRRNWG